MNLKKFFEILEKILKLEIIECFTIYLIIPNIEFKKFYRFAKTKVRQDIME